MVRRLLIGSVLAAGLILPSLGPLPAIADEVTDLSLAKVFNALDSIEVSVDFMPQVMKNCQDLILTNR